MSLSLEIFRYSTPNEAVADAVMATYYQFIRETFEHYARMGERLPLKDIQNILLSTTAEECQDASAYTLYWLANNPRCSSLFDKYMLVRSYDNNPIEGRNCLNHVVFLTMDVNGMWHLGSPANYSIEREDLGILKMASSKDLSKLTTHFSEYPEGDWPSAEYISKIAKNTSMIKPSTARHNAIKLFSIDCLSEILPRQVEITLEAIRPIYQPNL